MASSQTIEIGEDVLVDAEIASYLNLSNLKSFFLFAGAGSGKTRSLVNALRFIKENSGRALLFSGRKVGVITYTNAACDEIKKRVDFDPLFEISTIHSFVWAMIKGFNIDIKVWVTNNLKTEIAELEDAESRGRGGKASVDRKASIAAKLSRLKLLEQVKVFTYNPNGENSGYDALNHAEVIKIGSDFLHTKPMMQNLLISKFPILLIDESQDTNKSLMESLLHIENTNQGKFLLGLFGDTMQRIYTDGKIDLGTNLPEHWMKPGKKINYRSPNRIIQLINKIRSTVDGQEQKPSNVAREGFVHLFILSQAITNKELAESKVQDEMIKITGDSLWSGANADVKKLILEHHMAAKRFGFLDMFENLYQIDRFRTGLLDGTLSIVKIFSHLVLPVLKAKDSGDSFGVANVIRKYSPLLDSKILKGNSDKQGEFVKKANDSVNALYSIWKDKNPSFYDILKCISEYGLFEIPERLKPFVMMDESEKVTPVGNSAENLQEDEEDKPFTAVETFLNTHFNQIENYSLYVSQKSPFDTHQGIKGREFPRVMVIIDDSDSRGFLFKYEKLFGVDPKTKTDLQNEKDGNDTSILRTKRLFYVTCSRAEQSLAIIAYSKDPQQMKMFVLKEKWFDDKEVTILESL